MAKKRETKRIKRKSGRIMDPLPPYCRQCGMAIVSGRKHRCPSSALTKVPLGTAVAERRRAMGWMDTAAQYARNEDYWRERAEKAEHKIESALGRLAVLKRHFPEVLAMAANRRRAKQ